MNSLNAEQISDWLRKHEQVENPHQAEEIPSHVQHIQFHVPRDYNVLESFVSTFVAEVFKPGELLFQLHDWNPWHESKVIITKGLWPQFDEARDVGAGGGCLFLKDEHTKATAIFTSVTAFGWKSYLYGEADHLCLYNWEGEIFDAWTSSPEKMQTIRELVNTWKFKLVPYE